MLAVVVILVVAVFQAASQRSLISRAKASIGEGASLYMVISYSKTGGGSGEGPLEHNGGVFKRSWPFNHKGWWSSSIHIRNHGIIAIASMAVEVLRMFCVFRERKHAVLHYHKYWQE